MKKSSILLTTCVIVSLILAGCKSQESGTSIVKINPISSTPISTASSQVETDTPAEPTQATLYLPTLFNNAPRTSSEQPGETSSQTLLPENWKEWPVIPAIDDRALEIYRAGIAQGNDPQHFSKIGDCQNIRQYFLGLFDEEGTYRLGDQYAYLQETIDNFSGNWSRASEAVRTGFNVASVLSPMHANLENCQASETPLACEIRIWNPSFAIISMETWTENRPVKAYEDYLRQIVEYSLSKNVLPIVATKADNLEGNDAINQAVANVAAEYDIPLWNFWAAANPLTDQALMADRFHLTNGPNYFDDPKSLDLGWPVRNLTGLLLVDAIWKAVK